MKFMTNMELKISKVKWWSDEKGYGFLFNPDRNGPDIFVHHTGIIGQGRKSLHPGDEVQFNTETSEKGLKAFNVLNRCPQH